MRLGVLAFVACSPFLAIAMWWNVLKGDRDAGAIFVAVATTLIAALVVYAVTR